jgi:hypothetical protein
MPKNSTLRKCLLFAEITVLLVKSHGRVGMLNANVPLRFHGDAVMDFCIEWNFTWYSQKGLIDNTTEHDHMQPVFDKTLKNVCIPFDSRIISPIPRDYNLVRGSSFGDRLWKASICTRRLPVPSSIFSTYTESRKSW